jgi:hypothetical protein
MNHAAEQFRRNFGFLAAAAVKIENTSSVNHVGLQAVDYFLWALQRFYKVGRNENEEADARYLDMHWPRVMAIDEADLVVTRERTGVIGGSTRPQSLEAYREIGAKKKPRI